MNTKDEAFIQQAAEMLNSGYGKEQIQKEIVSHIFYNYIGIATIDRLITMCMDMYYSVKRLSEINNEN